MEREIVDEIDKKSKFIVLNILIAIAISISALLIISSNLNIFFMGNIPTFRTAVVAVVFLVVWLFYGMVMGYMKKKNFIKFISFYWGISGSVAYFILPIGKLAILAIPVMILTLAPTYGLKYFINIGSHELFYGIMCIILSWLAGAIGYLFGYLLKKLRVRALSNQ
ncbi:putative membrane protein [Candidatus Desulfosporosinus infrequens]|uniref:Putative membrane protein n=1 Tax=Candidatus Desulfosporosinus infrequens TaxID=2043169 RepID=A0A2U3KRU3_9FIRM|nr:putative membrane protein [Candidatus Desulfosporosinus infrequens]